ncbi:MAG TPA: carboxypeptidase regulatory-like domain-containing protein [Candidatus Sulfotelmatobacter sp.]|nr:carboxypeptidase regulatory-like domain-containing protein [Candidatus Sulfotelmatobacter sp.]
MPSPRARWSVVCLVLAFCLFVPAVAPAQSTGGRILGRVADSSGAVLAGVKVTLTNEATGVSAETLTNGNGDYVFPLVVVGSYRMEFDLAGFKKNLRNGVNVDLNQVQTVNSVLQIGETKETVNVTSEAPMVDTSSTQLGAVMDSRQVSQLPLNARDTYQLLQLQPGVQGVGGSDLFYGSNQSGAVSVNGGRGRSNNFNVNGGDGNDLFVNSPAIQPTPDSIAEFRVLSNTFDAEYGRNSGAVINVVTKSGTNAWHGSMYEFLRNQKFNARGYLDPIRPDDKQNQFGGTFGGPIVKDRTFFFASYEGRRVVHGIASDAVVVPTAADRQQPLAASGSITTDTFAAMLNARCNANIPLPSTTSGGSVDYASAFPNGVPTNCFDPVALDLVNRYVPCPNADPTCADLSNTNNIFQSVPNDHSRANQFTVKVDHRINDKQNLSIYYYFNNAVDSQPFTRFQAATPNLLPGFGNDNSTRSQQWNISHTWTLGTNSVNEFRVTYFREAQPTFLHPQRTNLVQDSCSSALGAICFTGTTDVPSVIPSNPRIGITPNLPNAAQHEGVPFITIQGGFTIGNDYEGELPQVGNTYQFSDNFTRVVGNHTAKFGVDFRIQRFFQTLYFDPQGDYTYSGGGPNDSGSTLGNYLLGLPDSYLQGSTQSEDIRSRSIYLFAQDSWKIRPNITLNYGLRWEFNQPMYDAGLRYQTFRPGQATSVFPCQLSADSLTALGYSNPNCSDPTSDSAGVFPLGLVIPGDKGVPKGLTASYYKAFAPRIGIAWDPHRDGKTTIRGGFGIFYNPIEQLVLEQFQGEPPFGGSSLISEGLFTTPFVSQGGGPGNLTIAPNPFNGILAPKPGTSVDWSAFRPILLFGELQPNLRAQYTSQYNLGIQRQIAKDLVLSVGYVGSQGHRLLVTRDLNYGNPQTCLDLLAMSNTYGDQNLSCGPYFADSPFFIPTDESGVPTVAPAGGLHIPYGPNGPTVIPAGTQISSVAPNGITLVGLRRYSSPRCDPMSGNACPSDGVPVFSSIFSQDTAAASNYNSLQASLEKRLSHGVQFELAYTFSKSIDNASSFENIIRPTCDRCNRSLSLFDARHRIVVSYLWELPVRRYQGFKGKLLDDWAVSGITSLQSGFPISIKSNADAELMNSFDFELPGKPNLVAPFHSQDPRGHGGYAFNASSFMLPDYTNASANPISLLGNSPRTLCCGPGIRNVDFSVQKLVQVGEGKHFEFRAEFFNIFNHAQFLNPDGNISDANFLADGLTPDPANPGDFGRVKHTRDPRNVQFALKFAF